MAVTPAPGPGVTGVTATSHYEAGGDVRRQRSHRPRSAEPIEELTMISKTIDLLFTQFALLDGIETREWIDLSAEISFRSASVAKQPRVMTATGIITRPRAAGCPAPQFVLLAVMPHPRQGYQAVAIKKHRLDDDVFFDVHRIVDHFNRSNQAQFATTTAAKQAVDNPTLLHAGSNGRLRWTPLLAGTSKSHDTGWRQDAAGWYRRQINPPLDYRVDLRRDGDNWIATQHFEGAPRANNLGCFESLEVAQRCTDRHFLLLPWMK